MEEQAIEETLRDLCKELLAHIEKLSDALKMTRKWLWHETVIEGKEVKLVDDLISESDELMYRFGRKE